MADAEKVKSMKTEEEKVDNDQARVDQAGALTVRLEKKVEALSKVDHFEAIKESVQANVINKVKNQLPKLLPKVVSDFVNLRIESTIREVLQTTPVFLDQSSSTPGQSSSSVVESLSEYELKKILFDKMDISRSYMTHKHQELYDDLLNSMCLDDAIASSQVNPDKVQQKRHRCKTSLPYFTHINTRNNIRREEEEEENFRERKKLERERGREST
ncbi:hypothetical protein Tco_0798220 [Tanacetum coccineum]